MRNERQRIWTTAAAAAVLIVALIGWTSAAAGDNPTPDLAKDECAVTMSVTGMS